MYNRFSIFRLHLRAQGTRRTARQGLRARWDVSLRARALEFSGGRLHVRGNSPNKFVNRWQGWWKVRFTFSRNCGRHRTKWCGDLTLVQAGVHLCSVRSPLHAKTCVSGIESDDSRKPIPTPFLPLARESRGLHARLTTRSEWSSGIQSEHDVSLHDPAAPKIIWQIEVMQI